MIHMSPHSIIPPPAKNALIIFIKSYTTITGDRPSQNKIK